MMYHVDLEGRVLFEKINFREERVDLIENPLLGPLLRRRGQLLEDEIMAKRANKIAIYYLNMHKRYDLDVRKLLHVNLVILHLFRTTYSTNPFQLWIGLEPSTTCSWLPLVWLTPTETNSTFLSLTCSTISRGT